MDNSVKSHLKYKLKKMAKEGKSIAEIEKCFRETAAKTHFIEKRREEYITEAKLADKVYKAYITDGISRLEKVNGRFLASQSIKTDVLIEQNNKIIHLLEQILYKRDESLPMAFCLECGTQNNHGAKFCVNYGTEV